FCSGGYKADVLHANSTRYPWALRTHSMSGASAEQALQQRYARMCAASHNGKQGDQRQTYMPMLLGLWDAVGVVHELNGYRHDVVAAMARYKEERALEFNAMEHIEQIDTLLQRNAAVLSDLPPPQGRRMRRGVRRHRNVLQPTTPSWFNRQPVPCRV
ncbi:hypothetical protein BXO454_18725, partial [Xanthomonas oryzae pv. oryzae]